MDLVQFMVERKADILIKTWEHIQLFGSAVFLAILVGVPLGILVTRFKALNNIVVGTVNVIQTIPSLAILGFLVSIPYIGGIGQRPAIVALFLYSLLAIIKNTIAGINQIDASIIEAGKGMGMTNWQILILIDLPLAAPIILSGIRIATVICIGITTLCAAIGAGGLGVFIFRGLSMVNVKMILTGAIPAAGLALLFDYILHRIESFLSPTKAKAGR